jgi:hypothetical protein
MEMDGVLPGNDILEGRASLAACLQKDELLCVDTTFL